MPEPIKGVLQSKPGQKHRYQFLVVGLIPPEIHPTAISGIEESVGVAELPDRTKVSDGVLKAGEFTMRVPVHHTMENIGLQLWFGEAQGNLSPLYKKTGSILIMNGAGQIVRALGLSGIWLTGRTEPDLEMASEGEMTEVEWTVSFDSVTSIPLPAL